MLFLIPNASAGDIRDVGSVLGSGRSPGGGHSKPLQYSYLENPMDRGAWGGGGRLKPIGSPRVRHDGSDLAHTQVPMNHKSLAVFRKQNSTSQI